MLKINNNSEKWDFKLPCSDSQWKRFCEFENYANKNQSISENFGAIKPGAIKQEPPPSTHTVSSTRLHSISGTLTGDPFAQTRTQRAHGSDMRL